MTGYKSNSSPWLSLSGDDVKYPAETILPVWVLIKDGSRIGLSDDLPVSYQPVSAFGRGIFVGYQQCKSSLLCSVYRPLTYWSDADLYETSANVTSTFVLRGHNISLPPPTLTFERTEDDFWMHDNKTYSKDDVTGTCQPEKTYQWGFSFYALLAFCVTTTVYAIIMYSLWLKTFLHSRKHRAGQKIEIFRAVLDFADAFKAQVGENCSDKTEEQLVALVKSDELGISCANVDELPPPRSRLTWKVKFTLRHLFKRERREL